MYLGILHVEVEVARDDVDVMKEGGILVFIEKGVEIGMKRGGAE